jgi:putative spermidine/putrescine transport system ATP-binding protein
VTHDQEEALTMSDRLVVLSDGRIEQLGTPIEVYEHPASAFVAGFIGSSNVLERPGRRFTIRPEKIRILEAGEQPGAGGHAEPGRITDVIYLGPVTRYVVALAAGGSVTVIRQNFETAADAQRERGRDVTVAWRDDQTYEIGAAAAPPHDEEDGR